MKPIGARYGHVRNDRPWSVEGSGDGEAMKETDLIDGFPRLFHVTDGNAWPSIRSQGLLSTSALLDLYGVCEPARSAFESERRAKGMILQRTGWPDVLVRDQSPMSDKALLGCLTDGMTPRDWYRLLNAKVFFWTSERRLKRLLAARAGRDLAQLVLTIDTRSLVERYRDRILLAGMNTGATVRKPLARGPRTFLPIAEFPYAERRRTRSASDALVELTIAHAVPDVMDHLVSAELVGRDGRVPVWRRAGAGASRSDGS